MSDPRQGDSSDATQAGGEYPTNADPAYSGQYPGQYWGPTGTAYPGAAYPGAAYSGAGYGAPMTQPTEQLPTYWQQGTGYPPGYPPPPPAPQPPKSPRWLWIVAAAAVLLVAGLVLALVIVSSSSRESTTVAPLPSSTTTSPRPTTSVGPTATTRMPTTTTRAPLPLPIPIPTSEPPAGAESPVPTGTETVVYTVTGEGRAINITYVDTGGIMQTEFNVALPWSKQVSLSAPAKNSASVAIVNVGRDVTCSVTVDGAQIRQRSGRGLTICTGAA